MLARARPAPSPPARVESAGPCMHAGSGTAAHHEMETLAKFEIMDGAPVRSENIPIRCVWSELKF